MNSLKSKSGISALAFFFSLLMASQCWALGHLKLIAKTDEGRFKLILHEEDGKFFGEIREGMTVVTPVEASYGPKLFTFSIGENDYSIERWDLGRFISYGGLIQDERGISAQAEFRDPEWFISGTIENEINDLIDFEITTDEIKGTLELNWEGNYLFLKQAAGKKPGTCRGGSIMKDSKNQGGFWCVSSGSLKDAFFNNPEMVLAWIVTLFVK